MLSSTILPGYTIHNKVMLVWGGSQYFDLLVRMIDEARTTIHFQTYIFDEDATGKRIANALMAAARRNVKVFLLLDGFASQDLSGEFIAALQSAGINFRWFGPILQNRYLYFGRRLHHKVVVVDASQCLVGGVNISDRYNDFPDAPAWLDWALFVKGEVAQSAYELCDRRAFSRWTRWRKRKVASGPSLKEVPKEITHVRTRVNDWVLGKREISKSYLQMLRHAKTEVIILSSYFMPGREFRKALRLATKRGVKVRIVLAGLSDIRLAKQAERYLYGWMLSHRMSVYEYMPTILHGKIACCDDAWMTVGSYNLNDLSARASVELNLEAVDKDLSKEVRLALEKIIREDCVHITFEDQMKTTLLERIGQKLSYNFFRVLLFVFTFYFRQKSGGNR